MLCILIRVIYSKARAPSLSLDPACGNEMVVLFVRCSQCWCALNKYNLFRSISQSASTKRLVSFFPFRLPNRFYGEIFVCSTCCVCSRYAWSEWMGVCVWARLQGIALWGSVCYCYFCSETVCLLDARASFYHIQQCVYCIHAELPNSYTIMECELQCTFQSFASTLAVWKCRRSIRRQTER